MAIEIPGLPWTRVVTGGDYEPRTGKIASWGEIETRADVAQAIGDGCFRCDRPIDQVPFVYHGTHGARAIYLHVDCAARLALDLAVVAHFAELERQDTAANPPPDPADPL